MTIYKIKRPVYELNKKTNLTKIKLNDIVDDFLI